MVGLHRGEENDIHILLLVKRGQCQPRTEPSPRTLRKDIHLFFLQPSQAREMRRNFERRRGADGPACMGGGVVKNADRTRAFGSLWLRVVMERCREGISSNNLSSNQSDVSVRTVANLPSTRSAIYIGARWQNQSRRLISQASFHIESSRFHYFCHAKKGSTPKSWHHLSHIHDTSAASFPTLNQILQPDAHIRSTMTSVQTTSAMAVNSDVVLTAEHREPSFNVLTVNSADSQARLVKAG